MGSTLARGSQGEAGRDRHQLVAAAQRVAADVLVEQLPAGRLLTGTPCVEQVCIVSHGGPSVAFAGPAAPERSREPGGPWGELIRGRACEFQALRSNS